MFYFCVQVCEDVCEDVPVEGMEKQCKDVTSEVGVVFKVAAAAAAAKVQ